VETGTGMSDRSIARIADYFAAEETRQGLLARAALGRPAPGDAELARRLAGRLGDELRPDGSIGAAALPTIWRVHELIDLGSTGDSALRRAVGWVLQLQGRPGAYGEGCDRERHRRHLCEHYLGGFFSPAPPTERLAPITLPSGKLYRAEPAARFAISCLALRAVLRAGEGERVELRRHLDSLASLAEQWVSWGGYYAPDLILAATHALAAAGEPGRPAVERLSGLAAANQAEDGSWANTDFFHALEALTAAGTAEALAAVRRAVPALLGRQRPDGSFGPMAQKERALIALRALLWAERGL
jgi:hypothetical protein